MYSNRIVIAIVVLITLAFLLSFTEAGSARSASISSQRAGKIPRAIRAPFRNNEMMTARGFGKRAESWTPLRLHADNAYKVYDDVNELNQNFEQIFSDPSVESIPAEWLANELTSNPGLSRLILHRFVDTNKDGLLSARELLASPTESNDVY